MRILITKLGAIGDVIRTTSILKGLREKYQPVELDWLTSLAAKSVLLNNHLIDHLYTWEERDTLSSYDLVIGLEDELEICELVHKLGQGKILGAFAKDGEGTYTPSAWFDMSVISKFGLTRANELKKLNKKTFQQHMGELLGVRCGEYVFELMEEEREYGRKGIRDLGLGAREKIIGINTGAGKRWPLKALTIEKTIEIVKRFTNELGLVSLILGGEEEQERNKIIAKETGMPSAGVHPLRYFAAIIDQTQALLSSDSLALHFGLALKKPVVAFFGPTSSTEIELYGCGIKVLPKLGVLGSFDICST